MSLSIRDETDVSHGSPTPAARRGFSFARFFSRKRPLIGLDVGSSMVKAVVLQRRHGRIALKHAAMAGTPAGVLTEGALTDGITVARALKSLFSDYGISERRVATAVGGEKVWCQSDRATSGSGDLEAFVRGRAGSVSGLPAESMVCDFQPVESAIEGSVFWVCCSAEQVDWIREAVFLAGKAPAVVDPQACALANAYSFNYQPKPSESALLINIGARNLTIALMRGWAIAYAREHVIAKDWLSPGSDELLARVLRGLDSHWDALHERADPHLLEKLYVAGGAARASGLLQALQERTGLHADELDPFHRISYSPGSAAGRIVGEHGPTLAIGVGLALRSFEDL